MSEVAEVLERASEIIEERGLKRGGLGDLGQPRCALGAINEAGRAYVTCSRLHPSLEATRLLILFLGSPGIAIWNDNSEDDFEVIDTLKHCAKAIRNGELV